MIKNIFDKTDTELNRYLNYDLYDYNERHSFVYHMLNMKYKHIKEINNHIIIRNGDVNSGIIVVYKIEDSKYILCFMAKYDVEYSHILNTNMTKVIFWKAPYQDREVKNMFFDYIISEFPLIINDNIGIYPFKGFYWSSLMERMYENGSKIGLYNDNIIKWYNGIGRIKQWEIAITNHFPYDIDSWRYIIK